MSNNYYFLSGLPRSGTTLIRTILDQNPNLHFECYSALYQLLWGFDLAFSEAYHTLRFINRLDAENMIMSKVPSLYYEKASAMSIIDNYKMWCGNTGIKLIEKYLSKRPKIIICLRPMDEILKSFSFIAKSNKHEISYEEMLLPNTDPIMFAYNAVIESLENQNKNNFLYVSYNNLVETPEKELKRIYDFLEIEYYNHDINNIIQYNPIDDNYINMIGLHDIRSTISKRNIDIHLPAHIEKLCNYLTKSYEENL